MIENNSFQEIWEKIKSSKKILLTLHSGPDGDSFGSCVAMKYVLERDLDADVTLVSYDEIDGVIRKLSVADEIEWGKDIEDFDLGEFDCLLALDTSILERLGKRKKGYKTPEGLFVINIDHHVVVEEEGYGDLNYIDAEAPSTCSILIKMFRELKIEFDKELSTRLLIGVCTDSRFFAASNAEPSITNW